MARRKPLAINLVSRLLTGRARTVSWWLLLLLAAFWYIQDVQKRDSYVYGGVPRLQSYADPLKWVHVLTNPGFMVGYSELRRNPLWVAYKVTPVKGFKRMKRPSGFSTDWRTLMRVSHEDYTRSGFDRGHMAPNYAISQLYGRDAQKATFRMTNIVPQRPQLNQEFWQRLEEVEVDHFARHFKALWVLTGPLFDDRQQFLASGVEIPDAFYKVFLNIDRADKPRVLAMIVPQNVSGRDSLDKYVVTVDEVERRSGFDFFSRLPDAVEDRLEASRPDKFWRLQEVSRLPPRYKAKR